MQTRPAHYNTRYKHDLTPKQTAVLDLMAQGRTNAEIAERLGLTLDGAKWHVREILGKLGLESRDEAVAWWRSYRCLPARVRRGATAAIAWAAWKPAAIGGGVLGLAAAAGVGFLVLRGGEGAMAFEDLPGCELEDMRSETRWEIASGVTKLTYSLTLRDSDWYEGLMTAVRLSDRKVESPCRLETTAKVELGALYPIPDWPAERGPAPLRRLEIVDAEPSGSVELKLRARLEEGSVVEALVVEVGNWCLADGTPGYSLSKQDMFDSQSWAGAIGPLGHIPVCEDSAKPPLLTVTSVATP